MRGYISQNIEIRPSGSQCTKLYELHKTHKEGIPCRPILDMISSTQYN